MGAIFFRQERISLSDALTGPAALRPVGSLEAGAGGRKKEGGGRRSSPAAQDTLTRINRCYLPQHPEPQHPSCSAVTPAVGHSPPQQTQMQLVHSQLPVSQQPQQSHVSQPARWLLRVAGTKGTKASAARRIRLFMGKILCMEN